MDSARRGSAVRLGLAVGISAGAFWLALRQTDFGALRTAVAGASLFWLVPYPFICVALNVLRGEIWTRLLERRVKLAPAFWAYSVGFLVNNVLSGYAAYRTQLFLYLKACGREELSTMNLWAGMDAPAA